MYGLTRADLERFNHVRFLIPPGEDPAHLTEMVTTALRDGKAQRECRIWRPLRQEEFWADIHLRPLLVLDQTVLLATIRDITDRRRAEAEMRRLASIVENSLEFISIATLAGEIIYLNPAGCQMVGLDPAEQGSGHQLAEILEEGWRLRHQAEERQTLRATGRWRGQVILRHLRSGRHIPMEGTSFIPGFPILDERTVVVSILHDISERLAAEAERIATALRTERQMRCIIRLATSLGRQSQDPARLLRFLTEEIAATLDVDRASLWLATPTMDRLTCADLYDARGRSHTAGQVLVATEAPLFFLALQAERAIDAPDAVLDPRTAECAETYLLPNHISSLLAAPIRRSGTVVGVVSGEHRGPPRRWLPDEIRFMGEVADQVAQIMTRMEHLWPPTPPTPSATPPAS
jgi:PAS domain S-box-containing protein